MRNKNRFAQQAFSVLLSFALLLPGCGGGGGGGGSSFPRQPALMPAQAANAPVIARRDGVQIGGDVRPSLGDLSPAGAHGEVTVSTGRVRDGESAERVKDLLGEFATGRYSSDPGTPYISMFYQKPTIQIRETTPDRYVDDVIRVVQLINAALPYDKRISISPERAIHPSDRDYNRNYVPAGHIYVGFGPQSTWPALERPPVIVGGVESSLVGAGGGPSSYIWVNTDVVVGTNQVRVVLAHEIFHALGFTAHIDPNEYRTVMNTDYVNSPPVTYLPQIDTDTLYALYTRFFHEYGFRAYDPNDLGPWTDLSFHLRGDMDDVSFGASSRNGLIQPWAHGRSPATNLADNPALTGSASWSGRLLGFTSESQSLAGAADLTVNLATLRGQIDFTGLEHWGVNATPGAIGSGQTWNDGDLGYGVIVRGNTFTQTGGDAGEVTGAFFGARHEGMGGVVERSDMSAGFGGTR
ncbi:MAG: hypothetical protein OXL41_11465 [Nitrospinae bacterium]|nr:hypothetical protein [Nitrospinota bacterium]